MMGISYKDAGVDVDAGYAAVKLMKASAARTFNKYVLGTLGSFGGMFALDTEGMEAPVLVAGTDGVGTKLKLAFLLDRHNTIGQDCVAMCVNDILCQGAKPLFFLDYIATGKLVPQVAADVVEGISEGCLQAGCALIGGETAEMPGFYQPGEYDVAGFCVGIVDKHKIIDGSGIQEGDVLLGLESSGVHSNGFSLIRKLLVDGPGGSCLNERPEGFSRSLGEELLTPTRIYVKPVLNILKQVKILGMAHITGGGFLENIPRMLPASLSAEIHLGSWPIPPIFDRIQSAGSLEHAVLFNTFNMGIGLVMACRPADAEKAAALLTQEEMPAHIIGTVQSGDEGVVFTR